MNDKLIEAKQRWAREGRLLTGTLGDPERDRLPPGQRLVQDWPVLDLGARTERDAGKIPPRPRWRGGAQAQPVAR